MQTSLNSWLWCPLQRLHYCPVRHHLLWGCFLTITCYSFCFPALRNLFSNIIKKLVSSFFLFYNHFLLLLFIIYYCWQCLTKICKICCVSQVTRTYCNLECNRQCQDHTQIAYHCLLSRQLNPKVAAWQIYCLLFNWSINLLKPDLWLNTSAQSVEFVHPNEAYMYEQVKLVSWQRSNVWQCLN